MGMISHDCFLLCVYVFSHFWFPWLFDTDSKGLYSLSVLSGWWNCEENEETRDCRILITWVWFVMCCWMSSFCHILSLSDTSNEAQIHTLQAHEPFPVTDSWVSFHSLFSLFASFLLGALSRYLSLSGNQGEQEKGCILLLLART